MLGRYPNITGDMAPIQGAISGYLRCIRVITNGAFYLSAETGNLPNLRSESLTNGQNGYPHLNAARSNTAYGGSKTVQPPAIQTLIIIKVWSASGWTVEDIP